LLRNLCVVHASFDKFLMAVPQQAAVYMDPPYLLDSLWKATCQLYVNHADFDHVQLAAMLRIMPHRWLLSYGDHPAIRAL
jgi:site-specific DNA-adenine methylase